jgi:hypothetical protein
VHRVAIAVDEADRDRLGAFVAEEARGRAHRVLVEGGDDAAVEGDALDRLEIGAARKELLPRQHS